MEFGMETSEKAGGKYAKKRGGKNRQQIHVPGVRQNYELNKFVRKNDAFFDYYQKQGLIPSEQWDAFKAVLQVELPASFRIQLCLRERDLLAQYIQRKFVEEISSIGKMEGPECGIHPPKPISFIPYAYQTKMSRAAVRSHPILKQFHEFLVNETELGNISRQECVSMIPVQLLDLRAHHLVLDACAAPGSKTQQIVEIMHEECANPKGLIVANDVDYKRCYLLVRQTLKRMPTANCVVVSHDASQLPHMVDGQCQPVLYDRILCDVICSGDGTLRKNPEVWASWDPIKCVHLHKLQLNIGRHCLELLKPGGLMVYSTCSLNPLEDEAVIAQLLRTFKGRVELVDVSGRLTDLKRSPGTSQWKVFDKHLNEFAAIEDVPQADRRHFKASMFPPNVDEAQHFHLGRTFRILPHLQDSGGFFVAVLRKLEQFRDEKRAQPSPTADEPPIYRKKPAPAKRARLANRESPFVFLGEDASLSTDLETHFGICPQQFPTSNLLVRSLNTERKKEVYYVNDALKQFLQLNEERFRIVNAGIGVLKRIVSDKVSPCSYRLKQDGLRVLAPFITKRVVSISVGGLTKILKGGTGTAEKGTNTSQYVSMEALGDYAQLFKGLDPGSVLLRLVDGPLEKTLCAWIGANSVSAFVSQEEKQHILCLLGEGDCAFHREKNTTRQEKAQRQQDRHNADDTPL